MNASQGDSSPPARGGVQVRRAQGEDLRAILDIGRRTWPSTYGPIAGEDYVAMGLAKWWTQEATIPAIRAGRVSVAEVDSVVVGMSSVGPDEDQLRMWKLYVLAQYQRHGVGRALMVAALQRAKEEGHEAMWLSYLRGNDSAAAFYHRFGFEEVGTEASGSGIPDSIVARRDLNDLSDLEEQR